MDFLNHPGRRERQLGQAEGTEICSPYNHPPADKPRSGTDFGL